MYFNLLASFSQVMAYIGYILLAILVLLVMVTIHELGHYIAGKIFKFGIEEFSIGFGPKLFSKKKKDGEVFSVRLIPLGGYCAFRGEDEASDDEKAFNNKKPWQRIIVLISGALMNYLLALILIVLMFACFGQTTLMVGKTQQSDNPEYSAEYSFLERDVFIKADGRNVYLLTDLMKATDNKKQGDLVEFDVLRDGEIRTITVRLRRDTNYKNVEDATALYDALGVYYEVDADGNMQNGGMYTTFVKLGFFKMLGRSFDYSFRLAGTVFTVLGQLLTGSIGIGSLGGTVTTVGLTAAAIQIGGIRYLLNIAALIGVNLAVFNLLPIPSLDGSRVIFTVIEWIRKKPINRKVEAIIHTVGFVLILLFAVFIDLQQCF